MSWIDDVKATLDMTNKTAERVKNGTATTENVRSDWEQIQAAKNAAIAERETYNAQLEGVKKAQNAITQATLGIDTRSPQEWDDKLLSKMKVFDTSENPLISKNVQYEDNEVTKKIKSGQYKLGNIMENTGLNNDAAMYIIGNTYQKNDDGSYYGLGWDGKPYSYIIDKDRKIVGDFELADPEESRRVISLATGGKINVDDSIKDSETLAQIYRSLERMSNYNNGSLVPESLDIRDPYPGSHAWWLAGQYHPKRSHIDGPDGEISLKKPLIDILGAAYPEDNQASIFSNGRNSGDYYEGFHPTGHADSVAAHELAHAADYKYHSMLDDWWKEETKKLHGLEGKHTAEEIFSDELFKLRYVIPELVDNIFGTHIVPTYEEFTNMEDGATAEFWGGLYFPPAERRGDLYERGVEELDNKYREYESEFENRDTIFEKAAKNLGFDNVEDATATISDYAKGDLVEAFAEAYTDVLFNGDNAVPYSKEVMRLYTEAADKWAKKLSKKEENPTAMLMEPLLKILPEFDTNNDAFIKQVKQLNIK